VPEARDRAVDEVGLDLGERTIAQPEPVHDARAKVLDQRVGGGDETQESLLTLRVLQIDRDRALTGVLGEE
jgi:hypothetical protein